MKSFINENITYIPEFITIIHPGIMFYTYINENNNVVDMIY